MSTGLAVFDTSVAETNEWLRAIESRLRPCERQHAYAALRAVLHVLRDRLPMDAVMGLSAQMPMLMRGLLLEGWRPASGPTNIRDPDEFAGAVAKLLPPAFPREPKAVIETVIGLLCEHVDEGEALKVLQHIPQPLRVFWPADLRGG